MFDFRFARIMFEMLSKNCVDPMLSVIGTEAVLLFEFRHVLCTELDAKQCLVAIYLIDPRFHCTRHIVFYRKKNASCLRQKKTRNACDVYAYAGVIDDHIQSSSNVMPKFIQVLCTFPWHFVAFRFQKDPRLLCISVISISSQIKFEKLRLCFEINRLLWYFQSDCASTA